MKTLSFKCNTINGFGINKIFYYTQTAIKAYFLHAFEVRNRTFNTGNPQNALERLASRDFHEKYNIFAVQKTP